MARLGDCASVFQLAFAVNAVLPAIFLALRRAHRNVASRIATRIEQLKPGLAITDEEMAYLVQWVKDIMGLAGSEKMKWIPVSTAALSLLGGFVGLVLAATQPTAVIWNSAVWVFAVYSLILTPLIALVYERWLMIMERRLTIAWFEDPEKMEGLVRGVKHDARIRRTLETLNFDDMDRHIFWDIYNILGYL
jgi:hypothetical protein